MCKEFWNARIEAADPPIRPAQTRLPEIPDQTEFLKCWYDYHRGYRIDKREDGGEERVVVRGEPLQDVAPGHLPRNLIELEAYVVQTALEAIAAPATTQSQGTAGGALSIHNAGTGVRVSESAASNRDVTPINTERTLSLPVSTSPVIPQADSQSLSHILLQQTNGPDRLRQAEYQARRIAALRQELQRMRTGIERVMAGLHELGEHFPESHNAVGGSTNSDRRRYQTIQHRLDDDLGEIIPLVSQAAINPRSRHARSTGVPSSQQLAVNASQYNTALSSPGETATATLDYRLGLAVVDLEQTRTSLHEASQARQACDIEFQAASARVRRLEREKQIVEQNTRIFGSREEVERLGPEYESPIANMFNRAYSWRARVQEEESRRRQNSTETAEGVGDRTAATPDRDRTLMVYGALTDPSIVDYTNNPQRLHVEGNGPDQPQPGTELGNLDSVQSQLYYSPSRERGVHLAERLHDPHHRSETAVDPPRLLPFDAPNIINPWQRRDRLGWGQYGLTSHTPPELGATLAVSDDSDDSDIEGETKGLDDDDGRPAPKSDEAMTLKMECKVCYSQIADVAVIPCGHLVLCEVSRQYSTPKVPD
ncbi:hypothetical protein MMC16_001137 [Acarospora aff. strigata]|nr:hypothetical protein [Acarospora aff. strigata]